MAGGVPAGRLSIEIVAEVARLQQDLDKAKRAVKAASGDIAASARAANDNLGKMGDRVKGLPASSRMAAFGMRNMAFQVQDLGVQLSMAAQSSDPLRMALMALVMQGPQIKDALDQTGMSATQMVGRFAKGHPILLALAAATGVAAGGFQLFQAEIEKTGELDRYVASLGLTADELEKLGPVTVTAGDAFRGLWRTIDEGLGLSSIFSTIADWSVAAFKIVLQMGKTAAAGIYAGFVGTYEGIAAVWPMLPQEIGSAAIGAANLSIAAAEKLLNAAIAGIETLTIAANPLLQAAKMAGLEVGLPRVSFGRIENVYAGAGQQAGRSFAAAYSGAFSDAMSGMDSFGSQLSENIVDAARERLGREAGALIDERKAGSAGRGAGRKMADEAAKEFKRRFDQAMSDIQGLEDAIARFGKSALEIHRMEIAAKAASAPTAELANRIRELGGALETLMIGEANREFEQSVLQPLRDEVALLGLVGTARDRAALGLEREAMMAKWAADGVTDLNAKWAEYAALQEQLWTARDAEERFEQRYGRMRDFLADVNKTPEQMAMAFEDVKMRGLDRFNDELVDAIINFRSLGDMASSVLKQILGDLLHLQLRKSIIGPLANMLGLALPGGGAGPIDLLAGTPFGGARAGGGPVIPGHAYMVGEQGRELFVPDAPGSIVPNRMLGANDNGVVRIEVANESELFRIKVNGQIMENAAGIAQAGAIGGASLASKRSARARRRSIAA